MAFAGDQDWLLLTFDDDFISLVVRESLDHAGIIYADQRGARIGDVVKAVDAHLESRDTDPRDVAFV